MKGGHYFPLVQDSFTKNTLLMNSIYFMTIYVIKKLPSMLSFVVPFFSSQRPKPHKKTYLDLKKKLKINCSDLELIIGHRGGCCIILETGALEWNYSQPLCKSTPQASKRNNFCPFAE